MGLCGIRAIFLFAKNYTINVSMVQGGRKMERKRALTMLPFKVSDKKYLPSRSKA